MRKLRMRDIKRYGLLVLAAILLIGGGFLMYVGAGGFAIHAAGVVLILLSAVAVRVSVVYRRASSTDGRSEIGNIKRRKGPGVLMWIVGVILLIATVFSYLYLHDYAVSGGTEAFPVYLFAGVGLICVLFWAFLVGKLIWGVKD